MNNSTDAKKDSRISETRTLHALELPFACPPKGAWNMHPRVFLNFVTNHDGQAHAKCPYCGAKYSLAAGSSAPAH